VKRALARVDPVDTYVFDEVDAGIGGGVAEAVGRLLSEVARDRQVICVTHLPQVAAFAGRHLRVQKRVHGGRTVASVVALELEEERRAEVARMLAGATLTDSALDHAGALMAAARPTQPDALLGGGRQNGTRGPSAPGGERAGPRRRAPGGRAPDACLAGTGR
jgi:DNA repair protein RecN (Recombination protein N)